MTARREVWVEFDDGSVAKYSVAVEQFEGLIHRLQHAASARFIWVDGRLWTARPDPAPDARPED